MCHSDDCNHKKPARQPMSVTHPHLAKELVSADPSKIVAWMGKKLLWRCSKCGYKWNAFYWARANQGTGCPCCANKVPVPGKNTLSDTHPDIARELIGDPNKYVAGSIKKAEWRCSKCSLSWIAVVASRTKNGSGCPYCYGRFAVPGVNSMDVTHPHLAKELISHDPKKIHAGSGVRLKWKCSKCNYEWHQSGDARSKGRGCPCCANKVAVLGKNTLKDTHPELAAELIGDPTKITCGSNKVLTWKCRICKQIWTAQCQYRLRRKGCPCCSNKRVAPGFNTMDVTHPHLAKELVDIDPSKIIAGTNKKLNWLCSKCGHKWSSMGCNRTKGSGCPACAGKVVVPGKNSMADTHPHLAVELIGDPTKVLATTENKLLWQCSKCEYRWKANSRNRAMGCGCPKCAPIGFDSSKPSFFYLLERPGQFQIGITSISSRRFEIHKRNGWTILDRIQLTGLAAQEMELTVKRALRKNGVLMGKAAFRKPFDGYTESWNAADLEVKSIIDLCKKTWIDLDMFLAM